jgi:hypothetical protein
VGSLYFVSGDMLLSHSVGSGPIPLGVSVVIPSLAPPSCNPAPGEFTAIVEDVGTVATTHDAPLSSSSIYAASDEQAPSLYISGCGRIVRYNSIKSGVLMPMLTLPPDDARISSLTLDSYGTLLLTSDNAISYYPNIVNLPDVTSYTSRAEKFADVPDRPLSPITTATQLAEVLSLPSSSASSSSYTFTAGRLNCGDELFYALLSSATTTHLIKFIYDPLSFTLASPTIVTKIDTPKKSERAGIEIEGDGTIWIAAGPVCRVDATDGTTDCSTLKNDVTDADESITGLAFDTRRGRSELYLTFENGAVLNTRVTGSGKGRMECMDLVR